MTIMMPACFLSAVLLYAMRYVHDLPGLIVMSVFYGFVSGGMVSLPPAIIANLTTDPSAYGVRMGVGYTVAAFGGLVGNPIAGACRRFTSDDDGSTQAEFQYSWIFAGSTMMLCTMLLAFIRMHQLKKGGGNKA